MTRGTEPVGTTETITITSNSSITTSRNTEPIPIGFFSSYLPNSIETGSLLRNKIPPPYPLDMSVGVAFPVPHSIDAPSSSKNNPLDVKLVDNGSPPYPLDTLPSAPSVINLINETGLTNLEREEIINALSEMECKVLSKSVKEKKEFFKAHTKVIDLINKTNSRLSKEEKNHFDKEIKRINEIRINNLKEEKETSKDEVINKRDTNDKADDMNTKCSSDITSLLLKFPQLVVDIIICIKGGMTGLTTFSGAIFFTISLTAALFTSYYLILYCICKRSKQARISEFLHSLVCTVVFLTISFYSTDDKSEHLKGFGFLATIPYGSEVCWKSWNFLNDKKWILSF